MNKKVPIQKGPLMINQPTMSSQTYLETAVQDYNNDMMRRSMGTMELMTPKQK